MERDATDMYTSLTEAAKATGKSRTTIQRAIKSGKISAPKDEQGKYAIDPAELHRVYPKRTVTSHVQAKETQRNSNETAGNASDLKVLEAKLEAAQQLAEERRETIADLRDRLDTEGEERRKMTAMLTDQRSAPPQPKGFWARLRGR